MSISPRFVECSVPSIVYLRGEIVTNDAVNMAVVLSMTRSRMAWYPDNTGKPALCFKSGDAEVQWVFNTEAGREAEYRRILDLFP